MSASAAPCAGQQREVFHLTGMRSAHLAHNDPWGEHDFGKVTVGDTDYFFKITYFSDSDMQFGGEDSSDPSKTCRVLTVMRADEH